MHPSLSLTIVSFSPFYNHHLLTILYWQAYTLVEGQETHFGRRGQLIFLTCVLRN